MCRNDTCHIQSHVCIVVAEPDGQIDIADPPRKGFPHHVCCQVAILDPEAFNADLRPLCVLDDGHELL